MGPIMPLSTQLSDAIEEGIFNQRMRTSAEYVGRGAPGADADLLRRHAAVSAESGAIDRQLRAALKEAELRAHQEEWDKLFKNGRGVSTTVSDFFQGRAKPKRPTSPDDVQFLMYIGAERHGELRKVASSDREYLAVAKKLEARTKELKKQLRDLEREAQEKRVRLP